MSLLALMITCNMAHAGKAPPCTVTTWNLAADWNNSLQYPNQANPIKDACGKAVWYMARQVGTAYVLLDNYRWDYSFLGLDGLENWEPLPAPDVWCDGYYQTCTPAVEKNFNDFVVVSANNAIPAQSVFMHPSPDQKAVVFWRSPINGNVSLTATFTDLDLNGGDGVNWYVYKNKTLLNTGFIPAQGTAPAVFTMPSLAVATGDKLYFSIDSGNNGDLYYDSTQIDVVIQKR